MKLTILFVIATVIIVAALLSGEGRMLARAVIRVFGWRLGSNIARSFLKELGL